MKRFAKRIAKKVLLFKLITMLLMLITTTIVMDRICKHNYAKLEALKKMPQLNNTNKVKLNETKLALADPTPTAAVTTNGPMPSSREMLRDWHDYAAMKLDANRIGLGEQGAPAQLFSDLKDLKQKMYLANGYNTLLSDGISVNRSLPDFRNEGCRTKKYLSTLPTVNIVIPFHNVHLSVLLRTIHSIINRTPTELLEQIILVDDYSDRQSLKTQLDKYIVANFPELVFIIRVRKRIGLITARLIGARKATADVLVFCDPHIECTYNWLPPLLEPIAFNAKIATCPIVDTINYTNFAYIGDTREGVRGAFDWEFVYMQLPLLPGNRTDKTKPYESPIMMSGLFAIGREFFWELGGYDMRLDNWGGAQYELSFKIWMCGGQLLNIPCSRVAKLLIDPQVEHKNPTNYHSIAKNHKRVAEVWMDQYKEYIYKRHPKTYDNLNAGDLSAQKAVRERLKCKSFKWFLEVVAPDILEAYPPIPPPDYASGAVQSVAYPKFCLDTLNGGLNSALGLRLCSANKTNPHKNQFVVLSGRRDLRVNNFCMDVNNPRPKSEVSLMWCHNLGGNQFWYYDRNVQWLMHAKGGDRCMEVYWKKGIRAVFVNKCVKTNVRLKWTFGFVNNTAMDDFYVGV